MTETGGNALVQVSCELQRIDKEREAIDKQREEADRVCREKQQEINSTIEEICSDARSLGVKLNAAENDTRDRVYESTGKRLAELELEEVASRAVLKHVTGIAEPCNILA